MKFKEYINYIKYHISNFLSSVILTVTILPYYITIGLLTFICLFIMIKFKPFKERIRIELKHLTHKEQTATCGGIVFILVSILSCFFLRNILDIKMIFIIIIGIIGGIVGFIDDQCKYYKNQGLSEKKMFIITSFVALIPIIYNFILKQNYFRIPLIKRVLNCNDILSLNIFYIPIVWFIFIGSCHSIGITDGINGGLSSVFIVNLVFLLIASFVGHIFFKLSIFPPVLLHYLVFLLITMCIFFFFNKRGKIFMGNVGSSFIGYTLSSIIVLYKIELAMVFLGLVYVIEALSVILQIFWVKKYKKKLFLFSPIHHHFELKQYTNTQIVLIMIGCSIIGGFGFLFTIFA